MRNGKFRTSFIIFVWNLVDQFITRATAPKQLIDLVLENPTRKVESFYGSYTKYIIYVHIGIAYSRRG